MTTVDNLTALFPLGEIMMTIYQSIACITLILLLGCSNARLTYNNFLKVKHGMTEQQVIDILGDPTEVTSVSLDTGIGSILGIDDLAGTNMVWKTPETKANIIFFRGKVKSSNFTNQF